MTAPKDLRSLFMSWSRWRFLVFIASTALLLVMWKVLASFKAAIVVSLGNSGFMWIFALLSFGMIILPVLAVDIAMSRDRRLYCQRCGAFLMGLRALLRINKTGECRHCGANMNIRKPTFWEAVSTVAIPFGILALYVVAAKFWL
jgi:hypothetical protein